MDLSERHVRRLLAAYREFDSEALAHGNRDRRPHNAVPEAVAATIVRLAATRYGGANHTHLTELLDEQEGIAIGRSTVRRILVRAGMPSPRRRRPPQHRVRRERGPRGATVSRRKWAAPRALLTRGPRARAAAPPSARHPSRPQRRAAGDSRARPCSRRLDTGALLGQAVGLADRRIEVDRERRASAGPASPAARQPAGGATPRG